MIQFIKHPCGDQIFKLSEGIAVITVQYVNAKDKYKWNALLRASENKHTEIAKSLIEGKADINAKDSYGWTALIRASYVGDIEIVRALVEAGADDNIKRYNDSALKLATEKKHTEIIDILLEAGATQ